MDYYAPKLSDLGWTADRVETLKRMHAEGCSASMIALDLGGGVTRNAVIGKIHRLKLPSNGPYRPPAASSAHARAARQKVKNPVESKPARPKLPAPAPLKREPLPAPRAEEGVDVTALLGLADLGPRNCRWPHGDPRHADFGFCGRPIIGGKSIHDGEPYCAEHKRRAVNSA